MTAQLKRGVPIRMLRAGPIINGTIWTRTDGGFPGVASDEQRAGSLERRRELVHANPIFKNSEVSPVVLPVFYRANFAGNAVVIAGM